MKKPSADNRIHLRTDSVGNAFSTELRQREPERKLPLTALLAVGLVFLIWISLLFCVTYREWIFSPAWIFESVRRRFGELTRFFFGEGSPIGITVYQYLAVVLSGAALSACGGILKTSFRNVLAGPSTMGVMAGGSLGCLIYLLLFTSDETGAVLATFDAAAWAQRDFLDVYGRQFFTLGGCFLGVGLVLSVATVAGRGKLSASAMILSGTVFSVLIQNLTAMIQYYMILQNPDDPRIETLRNLMMGSFNGITTWQHIVMIAVPTGICLTVLILLSGKLNLLTLDELEALTMGVPIAQYRYLLVGISAVLTAVVVAFCGHIGMLGFLVPLVGRKLAGPDLRRQLPANMLLGAIGLTLIFDAATIAGLTDYLNLFTSVIGAVVMLFTLFSRKEARPRDAFQN